MFQSHNGRVHGVGPVNMSMEAASLQSAETVNDDL